MYIGVEASGCLNACKHCGVDGQASYGKFFTLQELRDIAKEWGSKYVDIKPDEIVRTDEEKVKLHLAGYSMRAFGISNMRIKDRLDE